MLTALLVTVWLSAVMAGGGDGRLGYHTRNEAGTDRRAVSRVGQPRRRPAGRFPAFVPQPVGPIRCRRAKWRRAPGFLATLPWALCLGARRFSDHPHRPVGTPGRARSGGNADARVGRDARDVESCGGCRRRSP